MTSSPAFAVFIPGKDDTDPLVSGQGIVRVPGDAFRVTLDFGPYFAKRLNAAHEARVREIVKRCAEIADAESRIALSQKEMDAYNRAKNIAAAIRKEGNS